jgi:hypothetical protein
VLKALGSSARPIAATSSGQLCGAALAGRAVDPGRDRLHQQSGSEERKLRDPAIRINSPKR